MYLHTLYILCFYSLKLYFADKNYRHFYNFNIQITKESIINIVGKAPKVSVQVFDFIARHETDDRSFPTSIVWEDGRLFAIDKVLEIRRAACLKTAASVYVISAKFALRLLNYKMKKEAGLWKNREPICKQKVFYC